jgi:hypothetical protein
MPVYKTSYVSSGIANATYRFELLAKLMDYPDFLFYIIQYELFNN